MKIIFVFAIMMSFVSPALADIQNEWQPHEASSSAITTMVQGCMKEAGKAMAFPLSLHYCACMADAVALNPIPGLNLLSEESLLPTGQKCATWASTVPADAPGVIRSPYSGNEFYPSLAITNLMLFLSKRLREKVSDFQTRESIATCLVDATRFYRVDVEHLPKSAYVRCDRYLHN